MDFRTFVDATAAEAKEHLNNVKSSSQAVYNREKKIYGEIERYDPVYHERCDVEVVGSDTLLVNVPLLELVPHAAFRFRAGHRIHLDGWIGIIKRIRRKVYVKCSNGNKLKFSVEEESTGTHDSYVSNGKLPTWWDRINPGEEDIYSTINGVPYPGNPLTMTSSMEMDSRSSIGCMLSVRNMYTQFTGMVRRQGSLDAVDVVKKVKIKNIDVEWEARVEDAPKSVPAYMLQDGHIVDCAEVLAPLSQELCEEGSCRTYKLKGGETVKLKSAWLNEQIQMTGAPRSITVDEVDKPTVNEEWLEKHKLKIGDEIVVRIVRKERYVDIRWEDGSLELVPLSEAVKMLCKEDVDDLYEINIDTDTESIENPAQNLDPSTLMPPVKPVEITVPWLYLSFRKKDLIVDVLREYPSTNSIYGVIKDVNQSEFTVVVDWYEVDGSYHTRCLEEEHIMSVFDVIHMDNLLDPLFRIVWKRKRQLYGSEIVCSRFGTNDLGFTAGYLRDINDYGQVVANSDSTVWTLWPCDIERMYMVAYQTEDGDWTHTANGFAADLQMMKNFLPHYRIHQYKQRQRKTSLNKEISATGCKNLNSFPRLRKLKEAPSNHKYFQSTQSESSFSSKDVLHDHIVMASLVNEELKKTLIELEEVRIYFCIYEDRPELVSALMLGKEGTVLEGGVFMFDIYFPPEFPNQYPKVDYISYATKLSPILTDTYLSGPVKPLKFLNTSLDKMSLSFGKPSSSVVSLNGSYESSAGESGQGDFPKEEGKTNRKRSYSLTDFLSYIYEILFMTRPEEIIMELLPGSLQEEQLPIHNSFLIGKKLEALANMVQCPYEPWEEFMSLYRPNMIRLLESLEKKTQVPSKDKLLKTSNESAEGEGSYPVAFQCKGINLFVKRRLQNLNDALEKEASVNL